ncbi:hypothetical protein CerSpe_260960 [Prunus speciosa]
MGHHEEEKRILEDQNIEEKHAYQVGQDYWVIKEDHDHHHEEMCGSRSIESSLENSMNSMESSSSSDLVEDASSASTSCSSSPSNGPLYELSDLMIHLPMRRGLSKYYQGKAQSFTSLASVKSLEDLAKKVAPYRRKIKPCKSYGGGLDGGHKSFTTTPKAIISKKASSRGGSFLYSISKRGKLLG